MSTTAVDYSPEAAAVLAGYLRAVRAALADAPEVSAGDVEADVRAHLDAALLGAPQPVTAADLRPVLAALGPPAGWAPEAVPGASVGTVLRAGRRRAVGVLHALAGGPEDWRLAYLCFALTVLAVPTVGLLLLPAYLLGRAAVAVAREKGQRLGPRAWLVYPPLVAVGLPLFLGVTLWPVLAAGAVHWHLVVPAEWHRDHVKDVGPDGTVTLYDAGPVERARGQYSPHLLGLRPVGPRGWAMAEAHRQSHQRVIRAMGRLTVPPAAQGVALAAFLGVGMILAWWLVLGVTFWAFPAWSGAVFFPLLDGYDSLHGVRLAACSGVGLLVWAGVAQQLGVAAWV